MMEGPHVGVTGAHEESRQTGLNLAKSDGILPNGAQSCQIRWNPAKWGSILPNQTGSCQIALSKEKGMPRTGDPSGP